jgi:hypothetical protein
MLQPIRISNNFRMHGYQPVAELSNSQSKKPKRLPSVLEWFLLRF